MKNLKEMNKELAKIKLVISDVDGVLTDGGLYYSEDGLVMKKFNVKDGIGARRLRAQGIATGIISTDNSKLMVKRAEKLKMDFAFIEIFDKAAKIQEICDERGLSTADVAYLGDDTNDIEAIKLCGFSACPNDAIPELKSIVDYVCEKNGGEGAFREIAELILSAKK